MFTYVKLKNFLSFGEVTFDFKKSSNSVKRFVAVYGENGSGKSNFIQSFRFLCNTLTSFDDIKSYERISGLLSDKRNPVPDELIQQMLDRVNGTQRVSSYRTIECEEPTELEYGFMLDGQEGHYSLTFSDSYTHESLYYFTGKQRGYLFDIQSDAGHGDKISMKFASRLFLKDRARQEAIEEIEKYWGKHTFLAIVYRLIDERNRSYIRDNFLKYLIAVIDMFGDTTVINKMPHRNSAGLLCTKPDNILTDLSSGRIQKSRLPLLQRSERIIRDFFTQAYADIKDVVYEYNFVNDDSIRYQLFVDKMIAGKVRRISFENESAGTQQVLEIVRMLLGLFCGVTVAYDEIDNGVHDILLSQIIQSMTSDITGQLIITTHNTMLLEEMDPHSAYVIQVDYMGNKEVRCVTDYPVQSNNNVRVRYLKGMFGGTPYIDGIDYSAIVHELNDDGEGVL